MSTGALGVLLLLWALAGAVPAAWLAQERGRDSLRWALVGILYGPFAVIILGFSPVKTRASWTCPSCREAIQPDASVCPHCRRTLGEGESIAPLVGGG